MSTQNKKVYCGVDVSKKFLDCLSEYGHSRVPNTIAGAEEMTRKNGDVHYVFESTGGYERTAAWLLMNQGKTVSIVNPGRVREFAKSMGQLAKTDRIDARMIRDYARTRRPEPSSLPSKAQRHLTVLVDRRTQLIDIRTAESNRLETAGESIQRKLIEQHLRFLEKQIAKIVDQIQAIMKQNDEMKRKSAAIQNIKGLGPVCTMSLLAHLPELGSLSRKEVAALVGVAPVNKDSGTYKGIRHIHGGRKRLRGCLYMAAVSASRSNPVFSEFYTRLVVENHRPKKVALVAIMRKLVIAANAAVKKSKKELVS